MTHVCVTNLSELDHAVSWLTTWVTLTGSVSWRVPFQYALWGQDSQEIGVGGRTILSQSEKPSLQISSQYAGK